MVRDDDPGRYRFCTALHSCGQRDCAEPRVRGRTHCQLHICAQTGCQDAGDNGPFSYCYRHTCQQEHCASFAMGFGNDRGYCDMHRQCARMGCTRRCHRRDNDEVAMFCGDHYCHRVGCTEERLAGNDTRHCARHTCRYDGCWRGKTTGVDSDYCREHECRRADCRFGRYMGMYCHRHTCIVRNCTLEASADDRCDHHKRCDVPECLESVFIQGNTRHERCERHFQTCRAPWGRECMNRAVTGSPCCEEHLCGFRSCTNAKLFGSNYCDAHKCPVPSCQQLRQNAIPLGHPGPALNWGTRIASAGMLAGQLVSGFCAQHSCRTEGCAGQSLRDQFYCVAHKCSVPGCQSEAANPAPRRRGEGRGGAVCDHHYDRERLDCNDRFTFGGGMPGVTFFNGTTGGPFGHEHYSRPPLPYGPPYY